MTCLEGTGTIPKVLEYAKKGARHPFEDLLNMDKFSWHQPRPSGSFLVCIYDDFELSSQRAEVIGDDGSEHIEVYGIVAVNQPVSKIGHILLG
jgi:hypothetical protein